MPFENWHLVLGKRNSLMKQGSTLFTMAGMAALMSAPAMAATAPVGSKVHFATCTKPGVEAGCVLAASGGATYNVTGLTPKLHPYQWLQGTATVTDKMSHCMQGPVMDKFVPDKQQRMIGCIAPKVIKRRR
jgi:hypothetical protein